MQFDSQAHNQMHSTFRETIVSQEISSKPSSASQSLPLWIVPIWVSMVVGVVRVRTNEYSVVYGVSRSKSGDDTIINQRPIKANIKGRFRVISRNIPNGKTARLGWTNKRRKGMPQQCAKNTQSNKGHWSIGDWNES